MSGPAKKCALILQDGTGGLQVRQCDRPVPPGEAPVERMCARGALQEQEGLDVETRFSPIKEVPDEVMTLGGLTAV